jgi:outer membrane immunogenic protein
MKKILLGSVATGALVAAGSASAADLGTRPVYKAPPVVAPVPVFSWTGCFVGAHGGWGWGRYESKGVVTFCRSVGLTTQSASQTADTSGAIFGGQIGCDYQFATNWVAGIQGDFAGTRMTSDMVTIPGSDTTFHARADWLSSVTGRLGVTGWGVPRTLLYIRGGVAWVRNHYDVADCDVCAIAGGPENLTVNETRTGWTIGGGIEYAIAPNWSIFAEFNHYDFGTKKLFHAANSSNTTRSVDIDTKQRIETVKVGVNYRFDWGKGKAPVVAKY